LYHTHSNKNLFRQKLYQIIAGYAEDDAADHLTHDLIFTHIIRTNVLASQPSLSRFFARFDHESMEQLQQANQVLLDKFTNSESQKHSLLTWIQHIRILTANKNKQITIPITEQSVFIQWSLSMESRAIS